MNNLDKQYTALLQDILDNGVKKQTRNGEVLSVFGRQIRHSMKEGFPLLTTKKLHWKSIVGELLWFLTGQTNIKWLVENGISIWNGDAYKKYLNTYKGNFEMDMQEFVEAIKTNPEFAEAYGELGPIYGKQWRGWNTNTISRRSSGTVNGDSIVENMRFIDDISINIDQIANLINDLKTNPDSRRILITAWNPAELDTVVLPPCHYGFQVYTRELSIEERLDLASKHYPNFDILDFGIPFTCTHDDIDKYYPVPKRAISLMWNQRSVDTPLGLPFNIASYGLLLEIIAKEVNMVPDELIGNLGDCHIYLNQIDGVKEQIGRPLTDAERYNIWFTNNYETGFENNGILPNFDDPYWEYTPSRTREPFPLPKLVINDEFWNDDADLLSNLPHIKISDFYVENYKSHPTIKMPLSN